MLLIRQEPVHYFAFCQVEYMEFMPFVFAFAAFFTENMAHAHAFDFDFSLSGFLNSFCGALVGF